MIDLKPWSLQIAQSCMASNIPASFTDLLISPELAKEWLQNWNTRNRRTKEGSINLYAYQMKSGHWKKGSRIIFYLDGTLCDGQNRLEAVCRSGVSCYFDVKVGASFEEGACVDTGVKRSVHDALRIKGSAEWISNKDCVAIVNSVNKIATLCANTQLASHVIEQFAIENESWLKPFVELSRSGVKKRKYTAATYYAQLAVAFKAGEPLDELVQFNNCFVYGENYDPKRNAVTRFRQYIELFNGSAWVFPAAYDTAKRAQRAIYAFIRREPLSKLYAPTDFIYPFPVVAKCAD